MMFVQNILSFCIVLHISSHLHKGSECALVIKPHNVVAVGGEVVTLNCSSSASRRGSIDWSVNKSGNYIYAGNDLASNVKSYITVSDRDDGNCSLTITASQAAAKRYICRDDSGDEASAELIVIENGTTCSVQTANKGSFHVTCSNVFVSNREPLVACIQRIANVTLNGFEKNLANFTWYDFKELHWNICAAEFRRTEGLKKMLASLRTPHLRANCQKLEGGCFWVVVIAILTSVLTVGRDRSESIVILGNKAELTPFSATISKERKTFSTGYTTERQACKL